MEPVNRQKKTVSATHTNRTITLTYKPSNGGLQTRQTKQTPKIACVAAEVFLMGGTEASRIKRRN